MAEAPPSAASQMDQLILEYLTAAATPKKATEIARACSVTRQEANKVLYKLRQEGKAEKQEDQKWVVRGDGKETDCQGKTIELKVADTALVPLRVNGVTPVTEDSKLTETQAKIYKHLSENEPSRALDIAKQIGKQTRKDVNADLYALEKKGLLCLEESTKLWSVCGQGAGYKAANPRPNMTLAPVIIQNNPTNIIYQTGVQNTVSIAESRATQIGNDNSLNLVAKKEASDDRPRAPSFELASENFDTLHHEAKAKSTTKGGQEINVTESTLMNTLIGDDNQMNIIMKDFADSPKEHLDQDGVPENNPLDDLPHASARLSLEIVSTPRGEGREPLQTVNIDKSELDNVMIGNNNHMSVRTQGGSASIADELTSEEDDGSDSDLTSEQKSQMPCDDNSLDGSLNISILCETLQNIIIGNSNYMNVEETEDMGRDSGQEEE